jgi:hypothetical protein
VTHILASLKLFNNFNNPLSNFPFRPLIRGFVLEKAYKKLPVILKKIFRKPAGTFALWRIFSYFQSTMDLVQFFFQIGGFFGLFFLCCIQHYFICRPSDSTVSENAGIKPGIGIGIGSQTP